jgi:hypothetical protein
MEYIDYKSFMKKNWQKDHKSHQERLKEISFIPSNRIDNKQSEFHKNAPCRKKPKKSEIEKLQADQILVNTLRDIFNRDYTKGLKERVNNIKSLASLPRKFKPKFTDRELIEGNMMIQAKLNRVKSNFSIKDWKKQYKEAKVYGKMIAKPHVDKKLPSIEHSPSSKRTLIESYSVNF